MATGCKFLSLTDGSVFSKLLTSVEKNQNIRLSDCIFKRDVIKMTLRTISGSFLRRATDGQSSSRPNNGTNLETQLLRVAVIGEPNCGKSTLTNSIVGNQVSTVTHVPHTTRQRTIGVHTEGTHQVVLLDTPGVVTVEDGRRLKMSKDHMRTPKNCLEEVDLVAVVSDSSNKYQRNRIHHEIIHLLEKHADLTTILILNKIDRIRHKTKLLHYSAVLTTDRQRDNWGYLGYGGCSRFDQVFMVSGLTGNGVDQLRQYLVAQAKPSPWLYSAGVTTDLDIQERIVEVFRGKLLELYKHEIPWQTKQVNIFCEKKKNGVFKVHQKLYCRRESQRRCILEKFEELQTAVEKEIEFVLDCPVDLTVEVGVSKAMVHNPVPI